MFNMLCVSYFHILGACDCSVHGECNGTTCVCNNGFAGTNCTSCSNATLSYPFCEGIYIIIYKYNK